MASNTSQQLEIDFQVEVQKSINGIEMGVLDNGIPYLTQTKDIEPLKANIVGPICELVSDGRC